MAGINMNSDTHISAFVEDFLLQFNMLYEKEIKNAKYGLNVFKYILDNNIFKNKTENIDNSKLYADGLSGYINISKVTYAPVFASLPYINSSNVK